MRVYEDATELSRAAARRIVRILNLAIARRGMCTLVLAGGSTPIGTYRELAGERNRGRVNWTRVEFFWGDERAVPPDHPDSNYHAVHGALLGRLPLRPERVHRIAGELRPARAADLYETEIRRVTGTAPPALDLVLLGMGEDGHVASLFPGTAELDEDRRLVVATRSPKPPHDRVSLTLRCINAARDVIVLVAGEAKSAMLSRVLRSDRAQSDNLLPAALVRPTKGRLVWMVDRGAAGTLRKP